MTDVKRVAVLIPLGLVDTSVWVATLGAAVDIANRSKRSLDVVFSGKNVEATAASLNIVATRRVMCAVPEDQRPASLPQDHAGQLCSALRTIGIEEGALILLPPGPMCEEVGGHVAGMMSAAHLGHCTTIDLGETGIRAVRACYGGRAMMEVNAMATLCVATLRGSIEPPLLPNAAAEPIEYVRIAVPGGASDSVQRFALDNQQRKLETARVVVAGGRGLGGSEQFDSLTELAALLDGAVGASLPAVDAGWSPVANQVGQSGKFVSPELYLAVGISGTPQHMAGIGSATRVAAINTDAHADIFRYSDIGIVGDYKEIVPRLIAALKAS